MKSKNGSNESYKIIAIAGPTAAGKSDYAQDLAETLGGEIVNYDSQQFYRGLDIGTGKVPLSQRRVPHLLFDILNPGEWMSAGKFVEQCKNIIGETCSRNKVPLLVGGTGLYLRGLLEGLDPLPPRDEKIRQELTEVLEKQGHHFLYQELKKVDPDSASKINIQDRSRLIRFLEVYRLSGKPASSFFKKDKTLQYPVKIYWLQPKREKLRAIIAKRVLKMMQEGWLEEVRQLLKQGHDPHQWPSKPIGYIELSEVLVGAMSLENAQAKIIQSTQQYAKRQETFFRGMFKNPIYQNCVTLLD